MNKLKPCPFCGEQAQIDKFIKYNSDGIGARMVMISCTTPGGCCAGSIEVRYGIRGQSLESGIMAVTEMWNRRV